MPLFSDPYLYRFVLENMDMFFPESLEFLSWNSKKKKKSLFFSFGIDDGGKHKTPQMSGAGVHSGCLYFIRSVLGEVLVEEAE